MRRRRSGGCGGGGERERREQGKQQTFFFPSLRSEFLLSFSLFSLPAEPSRSLARSSPHTRRHVPRVCSQERAARAGRDGDRSGSGSAGKQPACFFFMELFSSASRLLACSARLCGSVILCSLSSSRRGENLVFSPQTAALRSARGSALEKRSRKVLLGPAKARAEKHASAFSLRRPCRIFFFFFDFFSLFLSLSLSLSVDLLSRPLSRGLAAQTLERGQEREFSAHRQPLLCTRREKKTKNRHRPRPSPPPPPPLAAPSRPRRPASPLSAPRSTRGDSPPGRRRPT